MEKSPLPERENIPWSPILLAVTLFPAFLAARPVNRSAIEDGRVFRGQDALSAGLVDELGNLNDAIEGARKLAAR